MNGGDGKETEFRAAQYVRMSTEHQQYSTNNQSDKIRDYASKRGIEIVKAYVDEGKSGLSIFGRAGLQKLLSDVESGRADFNLILVYDISRWGRFQDPDEGANCECICRRAGIQVTYCAEQFENDGSSVSTIVKAIKRAMAGEYPAEKACSATKAQTGLVVRSARMRSARSNTPATSPPKLSMSSATPRTVGSLVAASICAAIPS